MSREVETRTSQPQQPAEMWTQRPAAAATSESWGKRCIPLTRQEHRPNIFSKPLDKNATKKQRKCTNFKSITMRPSYSTAICLALATGAQSFAGPGLMSVVSSSRNTGEIGSERAVVPCCKRGVVLSMTQSGGESPFGTTPQTARSMIRLTTRPSAPLSRGLS